MNIPKGFKVSSTGMACSNDPQLGGIIDSEIVSGLWFIIFNDDDLEMITGLKTQEEAFKVFTDNINAKYWTE